MYVYTVYPSNTTVDTYKLIRCEKKSHEQQVLTDLISGSQFKKKRIPWNEGMREFHAGIVDGVLRWVQSCLKLEMNIIFWMKFVCPEKRKVYIITQSEKIVCRHSWYGHTLIHNFLWSVEDNFNLKPHNCTSNR